MIGYRINSILTFGLGVAHCLVGLFTLEQVSDNTFWFMGSGLALVHAGSVNIIAPLLTQSLAIALVRFLNLLMTLFSGWYMVFSILTQAQVFIGIVLAANMLTALVMSMRCLPGKKTGQ